MVYSFRNPSDGIINKRYLETSKIIAVVGLSTVKRRPVIVSAGDARAGLSNYSCQPRQLEGKSLEKRCMLACRRFLSLDIVDVYRRSEFFTSVARDFIETDAKISWAQLSWKKSRSRRNPSWSWTRRYCHEPLYQTGTHPD